MAIPLPISESRTQRFSQSPGWFGQLLLFCASLFFLSVFVLVGLHFGYKPYLDSQVQTLNTEIQKFSLQISPEDQQRVATFYSQLENLKGILKNHTAVAPIFTWLEKQTLPGAYYSKLTFSRQTRQLAISVSTRSSEDMYSQLRIFQRDPGVRRVGFNSISAIGNGFWQSDFTLVFNEDFFNTVGSIPSEVSSSTNPTL